MGMRRVQDSRLRTKMQATSDGTPNEVMSALSSGAASAPNCTSSLTLERPRLWLTGVKTGRVEPSILSRVARQGCSGCFQKQHSWRLRQRASDGRSWNCAESDMQLSPVHVCPKAPGLGGTELNSNPVDSPCSKTRKVTAWKKGMCYHAGSKGRDAENLAAVFCNTSADQSLLL